MKTDKKVALVTGANKGIGLETARQLAQKGFKVLAAARDASRGAAAVEKLKQEKLDVELIELDIADEKSRNAAAKQIAEEFGRLDVLINNAAILLEHGKKPSDVPIDAVRQTFETNFFAVVALTQKLLPLIRKSPAGRIVNLTSGLASLSNNAKGNFPDSPWIGYNGSKVAINMFTVLLARELAGTPIKVNAADPGWVKTDMGSDAAPLEVATGAQTSVQLATLPADGPTGTFVHLGTPHPW